MKRNEILQSRFSLLSSPSSQVFKSVSDFVQNSFSLFLFWQKLKKFRIRFNLWIKLTNFNYYCFCCLLPFYYYFYYYWSLTDYETRNQLFPLVQIKRTFTPEKSMFLELWIQNGQGSRQGDLQSWYWSRFRSGSIFHYSIFTRKEKVSLNSWVIFLLFGEAFSRLRF